MANDEQNDGEEVGNKLRRGESSASSSDFGHLLRTYRERANLTSQELADKTGTTQRAIVQLENGTRRCSRRRVTHIAQALSLSKEDTGILLALVIPKELAFIAQALEAPLGSINVGRLLRAYRVREGFTQKELADKMGMTQVGVVYLETGKEHIIPKRVTSIAQALGLSEAERKNFRDHVISQELAFIAQALEAPPGSINVNNLLKAYRIRADLSQKELADKVGTTRSIVSWWETGEKAFSGLPAKRTARALKLPYEDANALLRQALRREPTLEELADATGLASSEILRTEMVKQREILNSIHRREISEGEEQSDTRWTDKIKKEGNTKGSPLL